MKEENHEEALALNIFPIYPWKLLLWQNRSLLPNNLHLQPITKLFHLIKYQHKLTQQLASGTLTYLPGCPASPVSLVVASTCTSRTAQSTKLPGLRATSWVALRCPEGWPAADMGVAGTVCQWLVYPAPVCRWFLGKVGKVFVSVNMLCELADCCVYSNEKHELNPIFLS